MRTEFSALIYPKDHLANLDTREEQTISMIGLFLRIFDYIYLLNIQLFFYCLLNMKRFLKYLIDLLTVIFVTLRTSRQKVRSPLQKDRRRRSSEPSTL